MLGTALRRSSAGSDGLLHGSFAGFRSGSGGFFGLRLLFLALDLRFGHSVGNVFAHAFNGAERFFLQIDSRGKQIRRERLHVKPAARHGNGAEHNAAEKEKTVFRRLICTDYPLTPRSHPLPKPRGMPGEASGEYRRVSVARPFQTDKETHNENYSHSTPVQHRMPVD